MSITQIQQQTLDGLVLFTPEITIWGGTVTFDPRTQMSVSAREELPPHQLATDGRLQLIPSGNKRQKGSASPLAPLNSIRKAVQRCLQDAGFPFLGSTAVPQNRADALLDQIAEYEQQFATERESLIAKLPALYQEQRDAFPQWSTLLQAKQPESRTVRAWCRFNVHVHGIATPVSVNAATHCHKTLDQALSALLRDLARNANEVLEERFKGRQEVTQRSVKPIRELIEKLDAFSFLDPRVAPMISVLHKLMLGIPSTGPLQPVQINDAIAVLGLLSNPNGLLACGVNGSTTAPIVTQPALALPTQPIAIPTGPAIAPPPVQPTPAPGFHVGF